jgi:hypothetical protein
MTFFIIIKNAEPQGRYKQYLHQLYIITMPSLNTTYLLIDNNGQSP